MMTMPRYGALLAALTAATLTLAGCSSSSTGGSGTTAPASTAAGTSAPPSSAPATSAGATPPSHAALAAIPVKASDLPSGWKGTAATDTGEQTDVAMRRCVGGTDTSADKVDTVNGDDFSLGNATISSNAESYKSESDISADTQLLNNPKVDTCLKQLLQRTLTKDLPSGAKIDTIEFHLTPGSGGGPSNLVATGEGRITVSAQGQQLSVFVSVAFITGPLIEAQVSFIDIGARVDETLQRQVITAVAGRAASA
jgi:hypothetical protein